ncbi:MAG: DUF2141 domain-containing protein [Cyanobacteria bacterium P01_A01_bin.45]
MKKFHLGILSLIVLGNVLSFPNSSNAISSSNLTVNIAGLKNQKGQMCFSLFDSSRGFPGDRKRALKATCVKLKDVSGSLTLNSLRSGSYAVAIFHDANGDGNLNRNGLGIPTEGFGFSRNPRIVTGPPKFGDSAVIVVGSNTSIDIELNYFWGS